MPAHRDAKKIEKETCMSNLYYLAYACMVDNSVYANSIRKSESILTSPRHKISVIHNV